MDVSGLMMSSSVTVLVILSLGVVAAHATTTGADVDRHVCENILRSNEEIQRRGGSRIGDEDADASGAGNGFARPGAWRSFSSVRGGGDSGSFETRYSTREHGPYSVGTGYAKVSLDDPTSSPLMSNLIRRYVNTDSVWNDPGRQTTGLITAQIHFPRELMTAENSDVQLPVIVLAPPLQVAAEFIAALFTIDFFEFVLEYFASHGYITITTTEVSSREWNDFAEIKIGHRVIDLLKFVESQSNTEGSWLYGKYNGYAGVYGVSMGGGAGLYGKHVSPMCANQSCSSRVNVTVL